MTMYDSIETPPINGIESSTHSATSNHTKRFTKRNMLLITVAAVVGALFLLDWANLRFGRGSGQRDNSSTTIQTKNDEEDASNSNLKSLSSSSDIKMPGGVNFGSWLSLEDYFFAGNSAVEVATPDGKTVASCLPPLHTGSSTGPRWQSETDLLTNMTKQTSLAHAIRVFHAHRTSFIDFEDDLALLANLGVKHVRVPLSWCLTDEDPRKVDTDPKKHHREEYDRELLKNFTCADPAYGDEVRWPAVPRWFIADFLRACAKHGLGATLDMHTYPGATSIGTFSGLWPRWSRFWTHVDNPSSREKDFGRNLLHDFIKWCESLATDDPGAFQGLRAISPMNEPAHLAGLFGPTGPVTWKESFLPKLPVDMAQSYLTELAPVDGDIANFTAVPDGPHLRVLMWLRDAVSTFRDSSLPSLGKELHVNVHESVFSPSVLPPNDNDDYGGRHPGGTHVFAAWWRSTTTVDERNTWAVLDMHHYHAWEPACQGAPDGPPRGNYTCGDIPARDDALKRCASWATTAFRDAFDEECGPGARLASAEFSASTNHRVRHACNDVATLRASYKAQIEAAEDADVELFWWSYKMPYGGAFRPAWSFKHLMYLLGVISQPDESNFGCGDHVALEDEPNDDIFNNNS